MIEKLLAVAFMVVGHAIQYAGVIGIAAMLERLVEFIGIYGGMVTTRKLFGVSYHATTFTRCTAITFGVFFVAISIAPSLKLSLFAAPLTGIGIAFIMHHLALYFQLLSEKKDRESFNIKTCNEEQLAERCLSIGLSRYQTERAIVLFISGKTTKEIASEWKSTEEIIRQQKSKLRKRLMENS